MSSLFAGLFGPSTQDIIAERQDQLDTSLAGMTNPYERLGMLLGTAIGGRPTQSAAYQAAKAREEEVAGLGSDPMARANYLRTAIAEGRIPADKLKQAQQAIEALDPTTAAATYTPKEIADMYAAYTDESVKAFLAGGDSGVLVPQGNNKQVRGVIEGDADWQAYEGAELSLGDKFYDDILLKYGPRPLLDKFGKDNRLTAAKSALYNEANQIRFNSETPMTLAEALRKAKTNQIKVMGDTDEFSFLNGQGSSGMASNNTPAAGSTPAVGDDTQSMALDENGNPLIIEPPAVIEGEDVARSVEAIDTDLAKLKADLKTAKGRAERSEIQSKISKLNKEKRMAKVESGKSSRRGRNKTR